MIRTQQRVFSAVLLAFVASIAILSISLPGPQNGLHETLITRERPVFIKSITSDHVISFAQTPIITSTAVSSDDEQQKISIAAPDISHDPFDFLRSVSPRGPPNGTLRLT